MTWEGIRNEAPAMIGRRSVRDYVRRPPEELYDLEADPHEVKNLADDPDHREQLLAMRKATEAWQRDTHDPWLYRDGVSLRAIAKHLENGLAVPERFDFDPDNPGSR
nr:hypothetical protein [Marinicella sp. W31]MDC2876198.1 hypothetical protein [Marinicella sp. W31]